MPVPLVLTVEDVLQRRTASLLRRLGRPVRALAFPGLGTTEAARVRGRVLVAGAPATEPPKASTSWAALRANLVQFVTVEVPYARVRVEVGGRSEEVLADREGYVDTVLGGLTLTPGRHAATLTPVEPAGEPARATVHVPDPDTDLVVVSDIDDTIVDSGIAHGLRTTITTALLRPQADRVPLEGAPELYQALARGGAGGPDRPFLYLSTSPWNLVGFLQGFLARHGFPDGPLLLTDWGPGAAGLFRIQSRAHKLAALRELAALLPRVRFVLVGDSGQQDPEIYTAFAMEHPSRVAAVYIRRAGESATAEQRLELCARTLKDAGVPFALADDSDAMLRHARELGLTRS